MTLSIMPMSESAANVKCFFLLPTLLKTACADTLRVAGAEDREMLGSNPSADSGAKTKLGVQWTLSPSSKLMNWDGMKAINPRGLGTDSPEKHSSF